MKSGYSNKIYAIEMFFYPSPMYVSMNDGIFISSLFFFFFFIKVFASYSSSAWCSRSSRDCQLNELISIDQFEFNNLNSNMRRYNTIQYRLDKITIQFKVLE